MRSWVMPALVCAMLFGCAKGLTPPAPTSMIVIPSTAEGKVVFDFGTETMCADSKEGKACGAAKPPKTYPVMTAELPAYEIDEHEVTNLQYQHCEAHGSCTAPTAVNGGSAPGFEKYYTDKDSRFDNFPVVNVTHTQAKAYCQFVGKRLPTELEWEAAARATTEDNPTTYPWGDTLGGCKGKNVGIASCNNTVVGPSAVTGDMTDDAIFIAGRELHGMTGNVSEWVDNEFDEDITCGGSIEDKGCMNAFVECGDQSGSNFKKCAGKPEHEICEACVIPGDAGAADTVADDCFGICNGEGDLNPIWICTRRTEVYKAADEVLGGQDHFYRGGSYTTEDLCAARPSDRLNRTIEVQTGSAVDVGFRCARTL